MRLHHLQDQPGEDQGDHEEVWEAAPEPGGAPAAAAGAAVAAVVERGASSASPGLAVVVVRVT